MRLLRTDTENGLQLDEFDLATAPRYAILSHRWGPNEVLYEDLRSDGPKDGDRFSKLLGFCKKAREDGYSHVWIDTCCIDWENNVEVSQSINSTFLWYTKAAVCYVHLQDVPSTKDPRSEGSAFQKSVWFTRGWTLQELIAPSNLVFLTETWEVISTKKELAWTIEKITKISYAVLLGFTNLGDISVAKKMSWASNRMTTRVEDRAYSLLGIVGVEMSAVYGEGANAFHRLQYEIISQTRDYSIFAWDLHISSRDEEICGLLAPSPDAFADSASIVSTPFTPFANQWGYTRPVAVANIQRTSIGIRLEVPILTISSSTFHPHRQVCVIVVPCKKRDTLPPFNHFTIGVAVQSDSLGYYNRLASMSLLNADQLKDSGSKLSVQTIDIRGESKHVRDSILAHVPKTYQIVLKAQTLRTLRDSSNLVPVEGPEFLRVFYIKSTPDPQIEHDQYACEWVKDPRTKDNDFVVTVRSRPQTKEDDTDGYPFDNLRYHWKWADKDVTLNVLMDSTGLACLGCQFSDSKDDLMYPLKYATPKTNYHWSLDGDHGIAADIDLTLMDATAQIVHFELDLMIRESLLSVSHIAHPQISTVALPGKRQRDPQGNDNISKGSNVAEEASSSALAKAAMSVKVDTKLMQGSQEAVRWVPAGLGIVPTDAYKFSDDLEPSRTCHIVRVRHEGTFKLGVLLTTSLCPLIASFSDSHTLHRVFDYDVLVGALSLKWVRVEGLFTLDALGGAVPVNGGNQEDNVYVARLPTGVFSYGMVRLGSNARLVNEYGLFERDVYYVLIYA